MIKKHENNTTIRDISERELIDLVAQSFKVINNSKEILQALQDTADGVIDEDDELEILETCTIEDIKAILLFKSISASVYNSVNYYISELYDVIVKNNSNIEMICDAGVYVTDEWAEILKSENERIIGGLCYILWYEFGVDDYWNSLENSDTCIDVVLKGYFDSRNIPVATGMETLKALREQYKFKLLIFDEYPEKEDDFLKAMGPFIGGLDSTRLTVEYIDMVISGEMTPEELYEELHGSFGDIEHLM